MTAEDRDSSLYDGYLKRHLGNDVHISKKRRHFFKVVYGKFTWAVDSVGDDIEKCRRRIVCAVYDEPRDVDGVMTLKERFDDAFSKFSDCVTPCTEEYFLKNKSNYDWI